MASLPALFVLAVVAMAANVSATASGVASCTIFWSFPQRCEAVETAIVDAIEEWTTNENCVDSVAQETCDYELIGDDATAIRAYRVSFPQMFIYFMGFTIEETGDSDCLVTGHSFSVDDVVTDDKGTNYCNLENIIVASGLTEKSGYTQNTNSDICTDYGDTSCAAN